MNSITVLRSLAAVAVASGLAGCATATQMANDLNSMASAPSLGAGTAAGGSLVLSESAQGRFHGAGEVHDYSVEVQPGQHFTAIVTLHSGNSDSQGVSVAVCHKHPVTGKLEACDYSGTSNDAGAFPASSDVTDVTEPGTYVIRLEHENPYRNSTPLQYSVRAQPTLRGEILPGQAIAAEFEADDAVHDYLLRVEAGQHFTVHGSLAYVGEDTHRMQFGAHYVELDGSLSYFDGEHTSVWAERGMPASTKVVEVTEDATFVVRVESRRDRGVHKAAPYSVAIRLTNGDS